MRIGFNLVTVILAIADHAYRRTWLSSAYAYREKSSKLGASHPGALAKIDHAHQFHDVTDAKCTCAHG